MAIREILINPIYCERLLLQRTYRNDHLTHRKIRNKGEVQQDLVEEDHEPIIKPEVFDWVQEEMSRRRGIGIFCQNPSRFTGKIKCGNCGQIFIHRFDRKNWACETKGRFNHSISDQILDRVVSQEFDRIVIHSNFTFHIYLPNGETKTHSWKQTGRSDSWTLERKIKPPNIQIRHCRKGQGRFNEFSGRIFNSLISEDYETEIIETKLVSTLLSVGIRLPIE